MHPGQTVEMISLLVLLLSSFALGQNNSWQQRNFNTIRSIYNTSFFPNNQAFFTKGASAVPAGLFAENATGRISPVGNFTGFLHSVEYFFGLAPPPSAPYYATWTNAKIVAFSSSCPEVASSVVYGETAGVNASHPETFGKKITTIKQIANWRFDSTGAVIYYDAWLPNLSQYSAELRGGRYSDADKAATIQQVCGGQALFCTGDNKQWDSPQACVADLSTRSFGDWDELWGDNVLCRTLHLQLARGDPNGHCAHAGPTGGGKCVDINYSAVYFNDEDIFGKPTGETFICPGINQN